jgi:hypothetical protein
MDNRIFCRREDMSIFAVFSCKEWFALRNAGTLDAELKRRRESGTVIDVKLDVSDTLKPEPHFQPRGTIYPRGESFVSETPATYAQDGVGGMRIATGNFHTPAARSNEGVES